MPIYEYQCVSCGLRFERRQSISDQPISECPDCNGRTRKILHPVGIIFKGSGFYVTDNKKSDTSSLVAGNSKSNKESDSTKADSGAAAPTSSSADSAKDSANDSAKTSATPASA